MNGITVDNFDYSGFASAIGMPEDELIGILDSEEKKKKLYDSAALLSYKELVENKKKPFQAKKEVISLMPDSRDALGVPDVADDKTDIFKRDAISSYIQSTIPEEYQVLPAQDIIDRYAKKITSDENVLFSHPEIEGLSKKEVKSLITSYSGITPSKDMAVKDYLLELNRTEDSQDISGEEQNKEDTLGVSENADSDSAFMYGVDVMQDMAGAGIQTIGDLFGWDGLSDAGKKIREKQQEDIKNGNYVPKYKKSITDSFLDDGLFAALGNLNEKVQENAAMAVVGLAGGSIAAATGGLAGLAIGAGTAAGAGLETIGEVRQELEDKGVYSEDNAALVAGTGLLSAAVDLYGFGKIAPGVKAALIKNFAEKGILKKVGEDAIKASEEKILKKAVKNFAVEGSTEVVQDLISIGAATMEGADYTVSPVVKRLIDTALVGGTTGTAVSFADTTLKFSKNAKKTSTDNSKNIPDDSVVIEDNGIFNAFSSGVKAEGATEEEAVANLRHIIGTKKAIKNEASSKEPKDLFVINDDDVVSISNKDGSKKILFTSDIVEDDVSSFLEEIKKRNIAKSKFIVSGDTETGFTVTSYGNEIVKNASIEDAVSSMEETEKSSKNISGDRVKISEKTYTDITSIPIGLRSEDGRVTLGKKVFTDISNLESAGFKILSNSDNNISAYKDGIVYNLNVPTYSRKGKSRAVTITARTLDGDIVNLKDDISTQEIQDTNAKNVRSSVFIEEPRLGIVVDKRDTASGGTQFLIDPGSVDLFAKMNNLEVEAIKPDFVALKSQDGVYNTFLVGSDGTISATIGDSSFSKKGNFIAYDRRIPGKSSVTVVSELENDGYKVENISGNKVTLKSINGDIAVVQKDNSGTVKVSVNGEDKTGTFLSKEDDSATTDKKYVQPDEDIYKEETGALKSAFTGKRKVFYKSALYQPRIVGEEIPVEFSDDLAYDHLAASTFIPNMEVFNDGDNDSDVGDWTKKDVEDFIDKTFPPHIARIIKVFDTPSNPAWDEGAWGIFAPIGNNGFPAIYIDATKRLGRTFNDVIATIAHETAHFSFDSWFVQDLNDLVDVTFKAIKESNGLEKLQNYVDEYGIDLDDPTPQAKWLLINEFFAEQGTSIIDFDSKRLDLPPGVTRERIETLKKGVVNSIINEHYESHGQSTTELMEMILRLQSGSVLGQRVQMTYHVDRGNGTKAKIVVSTTPYGSDVRTINKTVEAERLARRERRYNKIKNRHLRKAYKWLLQNGPMAFVESAFGNKNSSLMSGAFKAVNANVSNSLKLVHINSLRIKSILKENGYGEVGDGESYELALKKSGETDKNILDIARDLDKFLHDATRTKYENVGRIRSAFRESGKLLDSMVAGHRDAIKNLGKWRRELDIMASRFNVDWSHRRYSAFTSSGIDDVNTMRNALYEDTGGETLIKRSHDAAIEIDEVKKDIKNGNITAVEGNIKIAELKNIIKLADRLDSLMQWAINKTAQKDRGKALGIARAKIDSILEEAISYSSATTTQKLELISSAMARKLNAELSEDRFMIKFLDPITDPLESSIVDIEQQERIIAAINYNNAQAISLVSSGIARPIGSSENKTTSSSWDRNIGLFQSGTLLKFIEVNPFYSDFIRDEIELNANIRDHALGELVGFIKQGYTVLSPKVLLGNYISNPSVMLQGGHLFFLNRLSRLVDAGKIAKESLKRRISYHHETNDNPSSSFRETIIDELIKYNVIDSSLATLQIDLTRNDVIQNTVSLLTSSLEGAGAITKDKKIVFDARMESLVSSLRELYGFGDDYAKILPYIINRELGIAKAETEISRTDFEKGERGDYKYKSAIIDYAAEYAATRTLRDSTQWVISPHWIRKASANKVKFFFSDWMMFPSQMAKIGIENFRILAEDMKEYSRAKDAGFEEYSVMLKHRIAARGVGNAIIHGNGMLLATKGIPLTTAMIAFAISAVGDDDNEKKKRDNNFTSTEYLAAQELLNSAAMGPADLYYPVPFGKRSDRFLAFNGYRVAATSSYWVPHDDVEDTDPMYYAKEYVSNFLSLDQSTIAGKMVNTWQLRDDYGRRISKEKAARKLAQDITPGIIDDMIVEFSGEDISGKKKDKLFTAIASSTGVSFKYVYPARELKKMAGVIAREKSALFNPVRKDFFDRIEHGDLLTGPEISNLVTRLYENDRYVFNRAVNSISAMRSLNYSNKEIKHWITVSSDDDVTRTNVPSWMADYLIKGKNPFKKSAIDTLNRKKSAFKKKKYRRNGSKGQLKYNSKELKNVLQNIDSAIQLLERKN